VAAWAWWYPNERFVLQAYVEVGEDQSLRHGLGERRARAVRDALVAAGVDPGRIEVTKIVGTEPVCADRTEQCRELNRRVEIAVVDPRASVIALGASDPERFRRAASAP
jgi:OOP family OmpA-OmpF porin